MLGGAPRAHEFLPPKWVPVPKFPICRRTTQQLQFCRWCLTHWGWGLSTRKLRVSVALVAFSLGLWLWQPWVFGNSQIQDSDNEQIEVKLTPLKKSVKAGETLKVRVEVWNRGPKPIFIRQATYSLCASGPLSLRFELGPPVKPQQGVGCAGDCIYSRDDTFAAKLASEWTVLPSGAFYGTVDEMYPEAFPQLNTPGRWRLGGTYDSHSELSLSLCWNLKPAPDEEEQLKKMRYQAWQGTIETNKVWIEVVPTNGATRAKKSR